MTQSAISPVARTLGIDVTVTAVIDETPEARTIVLDFPAGTDYRPGQFITVRIPSDRTGPVARSYSLSTAPNVDASPAITVKRTRGGYGRTGCATTPNRDWCCISSHRRASSRHGPGKDRCTSSRPAAGG